MSERKLFNIAKAIDPSVGQDLPRPDVEDDGTRPACPNCHSRMLKDVSPLFPIPTPKDWIARQHFRCSFCWARLVVPAYPRSKG
jgi:DNA-directed RNA polymerase subunit RPC12/RpoP